MLISFSQHSPNYHELAYQLFCSHRESPWSYDLFLKSVNNSFSLYALSNNTLLGYAIFTLVAGEAELEDICVHNDARNKGVAQALIEHFSKLSGQHDIDYILLEVDENNESAIALYKKCGFSIVGTRKDYYAHKDGTFSHALIMQK
ncbi:ribosomal protein S18-alanine N-acetyltransferase [Glaciecola sp. 2405UD65-10]|uniref:ribosomal protein S18-alanine N-acetyltransferase n=1 Tax=Glaciecola sp. 2405UD65-10 TaxID=3397244 RepID=UPI003B5B5834